MKFSTALLKGFRLVGGRQCKGSFYKGGTSAAPKSVCSNGAIALAVYGVAEPRWGSNGVLCAWDAAFLGMWGFHPAEVNDAGMPWEHIYGMARAAGL